MPTKQQADTMRGIGERYGKYIAQASKDTGLDRDVIYNIIYHESKGDDAAVGGKGDIGLTQLLPSTAVEIAGKLGIKDFADEKELQQRLIDKPGLNILFGAKYYSEQLKEAGGNHALAYSRYNGGPNYRAKVDEDGSEWRKGTYDAIASGDLSGTDEYSTNAKRFMDSFSITGYDPTGSGQPATPVAEATPAAPVSGGDGQPFFDQLKGVFESKGAGVPGAPFSGLRIGQLSNEHLMRGLSAGYGPESKGVEPPRNDLEQFIADFSHGGGMAAPFAVGMGGASAIPFVQKLLQGGRIAKNVGNAIRTGAGFGVHGLGERSAGLTDSGEQAGSDESNWGKKILAQGMERLPEAGKSFATGAVLAPIMAIPPVAKLAKGALGGPLVNWGAMTGMNTADRVLSGEPLTLEGLKEDAQAAVAPAMGVHFGNALAHNITPKTKEQAAQERVKERRQEVLAKIEKDMVEMQASHQQLRLPASEIVYAEPTTPPANRVTGERQPFGMVDEVPAAVGQPGRHVSEYAGRNQYPVVESPQAHVGVRVFRGRPISLVPPEPRPLEPGGSPEPAIRLRGVEGTEPSPQRNADPTGEVRSGVVHERPSHPKQKQVRDKWLKDLADEAALQGRTDLRVESEMKVDVNEQARIYEQRKAEIERFQRGDVTTDMMGGQQVYEYMSGKVKRAAERAGERREAGIEKRAQEIMESGGFWESMNARPLFQKYADGTESRNTYDPNIRYVPIEGIPALDPIFEAMNNKTDPIKAIEKIYESVKRTEAKNEANKNDPDYTPEPTIIELQPEVARYLDMKVGKVGGEGKDNVTGWNSLKDRRRFARDATGGEASNPAYEAFMRTGETVEMFGDYLEYSLRGRAVDAAEASGISLLESKDMEALGRYLGAEGPEGRSKALAGAKNPDAVIEMLPRARAEFERQAKIRDMAEELFGGGEPMNRKVNDVGDYFPQTEKKANLFKNPYRAAEQWSRPEGNRSPSMGLNRPKVTSSREMRRKGTLKDNEIEWNYNKVKGAYTADTTRKFINSMAMTAGQNVAEAYRARGATGTADGLSAVNQSAYNGADIGQQTSMRSSRFGKSVHNVFQARKRLWNMAKFTFNIPMAILTQPISTQLTNFHGNVTPAVMFRAAKAMATPEFSQRFNASYLKYIKNKGGGLLKEGSTSQDFLGGDLKSGRAREVGDAVLRGVTSPNRMVENLTGRWAYAVAEQLGMESGFKGAKLRGFADDVAGLTQSYFDVKNRAPVASNALWNSLFPAQGYAIEGLNSVLSTMKNQTGAKRFTKMQRAQFVGNALVQLYFANAMRTYVMNYHGEEEDFAGVMKDPDFSAQNLLAVGKNFTPFGAAFGIDALRDGVTDPRQMARSAMSGSKTMPAQTTANLLNGLAEMLSTGEYDADPSRALAVWSNDFLIGGANFYRAEEATKAYEEGKINESDLPWAWMWGWRATPSGKETMANGGRAPSGGRPRSPKPPKRPSRPRRN